MKSLKILFTTTALVLFFALTYSCDKKKTKAESSKADTSKPLITLNGDANMTIQKGSTVSDPGSTAIDDKDGDITSEIKSNWAEKVKFNETGTYEVTYSVSDKNGNQATATRMVNVKNGAGSLLGEWDSQYTGSSGTTSVYTSTISLGDNTNQIVIYPFGGLQISMKMNMVGLLGNDLTYSQTDFGITSSGTGKIINGGKTILLTFTTSGSGGGTALTGTLNLK